MHRLARFLDPRNTIEGKIVSVILSVVLVFSMVNLSAVVENASAAGSDGDALFTTELATDDKAKTQTEGGEPSQNQIITDEQTETNTPDSNQPDQKNNGVATLSLDDDQNGDESNNTQNAPQQQQQRAAAAPAAQANNNENSLNEYTLTINKRTTNGTDRIGRERKYTFDWTYSYYGYVAKAEAVAGEISGYDFINAKVGTTEIKRLKVEAKSSGRWPNTKTTYILYYSDNESSYNANWTEVNPNDVVFYYSKQAITASFEKNNGDIASIDPIKSDNNDSLTFTLPTPDPQEPGTKYFKGWATSKTAQDEELLPAGKELTITQSTKYYAIWGQKLTLSFGLNGGQGTTPSNILEKNAKNVILPSNDGFTKSGSTFIGWAKDKNIDTQKTNVGIYAAGSEYYLDNSHTLYALWSKSYSIDTARFFIRLDGRVLQEPTTGTDAENYTGAIGDNYKASEIIKTPVFTADQTGQAVVDNLNSYPTYEMVKDAVKVTDKYGTTLKDNFGDLVDFNKHEYKVIWYVLKYHSDDGWHIDGTIIRADSATVNYEKNTTATLNGEPVQPDVVAFPNGDQEAQATVKNSSWTRPGYEFIGWNTAADGSGAQYAVGDRIDLKPKDNVTLYAQWQEKGKVTIQYQATDGGSVSKSSESVNPETGETQGSVATALDGYTFVNWTDANGNVVSTDAEFKPSKNESSVYEAATYTANFVKPNVALDDWTYGETAAVENPSVVGPDSKGYATPTYSYYVNGSKDALSAKPTNAGSYKVVATWAATGNLPQLTAEDTFTINKRDVTFTGKSDTKTYNGQEQEVTGYDATGLVEEQVATLEASAKGTAAGEHTGTITDKAAVVIKDAEGNVTTGNYNITTVAGKLTITAITTPITITAGSQEYTYDGTAHQASAMTTPATYTEGVLIAGDNLVIDVNGSATNVGDEGTTSVASYKVMRGDTDVTNSYTFNPSETGKITINKRDVVITTESANRVYNGQALTASGVIEGIIEDETVDFNVTGSRTEIGSAENTYSLNWNGSASEDNYQISENLGTLTVVPQSINPVDPTEPTDDPNQPVYNGVQVSTPENVIYNGQTQNQPIQVTDADGNALPEDAYTVTYTDAVNVGTVTVTITGQGNYAGQVTRTYQITPATLTVTTPSATKTFDGAALTNTAGTLEGLQGNDSVAFTVNGTQTAVGNSVNTYAIDWKNALASNYTIVEDLGTLTVNAVPVVPVVPTPTPVPAGPGVPAVAPGVPTPAAAAAAAPLAAPVATITDDATPLAAGETIDDEDTPLAAFDHVDCWVHWFILVGIILTAIYGAVVVRRRLAVVKDVDDLEDEVLDGAVAGATQSAPADNRQAI